jgi:LuxR family maltose regulon positive regulatory protein
MPSPGTAAAAPSAIAPGYGKTTALAQWAASEPQRRSAWVSVDRHDNDPVVLRT